MGKSQRRILTAATHPQPSTFIPQPFRFRARRPSLAQAPDQVRRRQQNRLLQIVRRKNRAPIICQETGVDADDPDDNSLHET